MLEKLAISFKEIPILALCGVEGLVDKGAVAKKWLQLEKEESVSLPDTPEQTPPVERTPPRKRQRTSNSSLSSSSSPGDRPKTTKVLCHKRDDNRCIITEADLPVEVAHIFPFSMQKFHTPQGERGPWDVLKSFWTETRGNSWHHAISTAAGTEIVQNLLSFAPNVHAYHGKADFALQPQRLSEDKKSLTVGFYWLSQMSKLPKKVSLLTTPELLTNLDMCGNSERCVKLWNVPSERKICSGDEITFKTEDPEKMPLPSWELLEMQWILHRLSALSGALEAEDDVESDYDD